MTNDPHQHHLPARRYGWNSTEVAPRQPQAVVAIAAAAGYTITVTSTAAIVGGAVLSTLASLALSFITNALFAPKKPKPEHVKSELRQPTSLPQKRFCYGEFFAPATPAPWRVKNNRLFACFILNSRPSDGSNLQIRVDGRDVNLTGDAFDFTGSGAVPADGPLLNEVWFWVGLGDQTGPPDDVLSFNGEDFQATDGWNGLTVLWMAADVGPAVSQRERWPNGAPNVEVSMRWSKVWDWRDAAQSLGDPDTWTWSANQALCTVDALTQNPMQPYQENDLDLDGGWTEQADAADEDVDLAAGGTEKRYEAHGLLVFGGDELEQILDPLFRAGASEPLVVGGQTSVVPGAYQAPSETVTDIISDFTWDTMAPVRDIANTIRTTYRNRNRNEEGADLPPFSLSGAVAEDGGIPSEHRLDLAGFVTSATQAARIQKIVANQMRAQLRITGTLPPTLFNLVAGAGVTVSLPSPYDAMDGIYQVVEVTPSIMGAGNNGGVSMQLPVVLREYSSDWYSWDTSEEPDLPTDEAVSQEIPALEAPASLTVTEAPVEVGETIILQALLEWPPVSAEVIGYHVQARVSGDWTHVATVDEAVRNGSGNVFHFVQITSVGTHDFRVRSYRHEQASAWVEALANSIGGPAVSLTAPTSGSATAQGSASIAVQYTLPNESAVHKINFYSGATSSTGSMTQFASIFADANDVVQVTETGLAGSQTRYYATKAADSLGSESAFSAVVSATTDADNVLRDEAGDPILDEASAQILDES